MPHAIIIEASGTNCKQLYNLFEDVEGDILENNPQVSTPSCDQASCLQSRTQKSGHVLWVVAHERRASCCDQLQCRGFTA